MTKRSLRPIYYYPANTRRSPNVVFMSGQRRRRWTDNKTTLVQHLTQIIPYNSCDSRLITVHVHVDKKALWNQEIPESSYIHVTIISYQQCKGWDMYEIDALVLKYIYVYMVISDYNQNPKAVLDQWEYVFISGKLPKKTLCKIIIIWHCVQHCVWNCEWNYVWSVLPSIVYGIVFGIVYALFCGIM